jgi:capsular exopolysaccharide synthesis family protein
MSRIQDILDKAERDGALRRTRLGTMETGGGGAAASALTLPLPPAEPPPIDSHHLASPAVAAPADARLDPHLVAALAPHSLAAEQYRSLRTRLARAENSGALRVLIVTSPGKGDGKSLTAANLALTMAQEFQHRVLLLDADLRQPAVHTLFGVSSQPGLSDVLMGGASIDEALVAIPDHHLTVLPAGAIPSHPAELLGSAGMRRVVDTLRARFDRIILDMPPVAPLADVHIALPHAQGLLLIVRAGITPKPAIERALDGLDMTKVLGLVLNEAGDDSEKDYPGYGYVAG